MVATTDNQGCQTNASDTSDQGGTRKKGMDTGCAPDWKTSPDHSDSTRL